MATLYITEYSRLEYGPDGNAQIAEEPEVASQTVGITGASAASSTFNESTRFVRIHTDAICSIVFGTAPVAVTGNRRLPADNTEYFGVPIGQSFKVAAIANT